MVMKMTKRHGIRRNGFAIVIVVIMVWGMLLLGFSRTEARPPKVASPFVLQDVDGREYDAHKIIGKKPLLMIFSTTWCPACNSLLPEFKKLYQRYTPRGVEVVGINLGETAQKVSAWTLKNGIPYRILIDGRQSVGNAYNIMGVPTLVLIDRQGKVACNPCRSPAAIEEALN